MKFDEIFCVFYDQDFNYLIVTTDHKSFGLFFAWIKATDHNEEWREMFRDSDGELFWLGVSTAFQTEKMATPAETKQINFQQV